MEGRRVRPCGLALADGTVWDSSSKRPYRAPFGALLVVLGFLAKYPPKVLAKISATGMVEAALAPLHMICFLLLSFAGTTLEFLVVHNIASVERMSHNNYSGQDHEKECIGCISD